MGKVGLFLLVAALCLSVTLQRKEKQRLKSPRNRSRASVPVPRTFRGVPVDGTHLFILPNGTQAPVSSRSPPALQSLSNMTVWYLRSPLSTRAIPAVYILAMAVGIPANVAILCVLASKVRKVSSAILYCSLAVSDLLLLLSLGFKAHYHLHGNHWVLGEAACRVVTACFYGNLYCSALTLACVSAKRYLAVVHPFLYKSLPKRTCAGWACAAVWAAFGAAVVPELLVQQTYLLPQVGGTTCHDVQPLDHGAHAFTLYYNLLLTVLCLLLPLALTAACYARIVAELSRSHHDWATYIRTSSLTLAIFLACFTPAGVLYFVHHVQRFPDAADGVFVCFKMAACLCCVHACLDPFLFLLMSRSAGSAPYFSPCKSKILSVSF